MGYNPGKLAGTIDPSKFYEFIYDRQLVWYNRNKNIVPWTKDPILKQFRFCNVYRELDKCSQHLIWEVIKSKRFSLGDKLFYVILYRKFNTYRFFREVLPPIPIESFKVGRWINAADAAKKRGFKLFNSAYLIHPIVVDKKYRPQEKHVQILLSMDKLRRDIPLLTSAILRNNYKESHQILIDSVPCSKGFMAQQYLIDLTYISEFRKNWNVDSFVDVGPGARPAVDMMIPDKKTFEIYEKFCQLFHISQEEKFKELKQRTKKDFLKIKYDTPYYSGPYLSLSNIQNCLCEFRKYIFLQKKPVTRRRLYRPL